MTAAADMSALRDALARARGRLLASRGPDGWWEGRLSSSALSTATAVFALERIDANRHAGLIAGGLDWLVRHRNGDGGWGDTPESRSNLATTALVWSALSPEEGSSSAVRQAAEGARAWLADRLSAIDAAALAAGLEERFHRQISP